MADDRWEDIFQNEIIPNIPNDNFKSFARSGSGLGLENHVIDEITTDYPRSKEQKMKLLFEWKSRQRDASFDMIRRIMNQYLSPNIEMEFCDLESCPLTETIRIYPNRTLGSRDFILEGKMKMVGGIRPLAIKMLKWDDDTEKEAKILLQLENHQNVISFVQSGSTEQGFFKYLYIAMELCHPQNLFEYVTKPLSYPVAYSYALQLIHGLQHIHSRGITHRDLKPHNILLSTDLKLAKIADFGLSKIVPKDHSGATTTSRTYIGTNGYKAPESYNDGKYTKKGDIFSLGLVIHFTWSGGEHPFGQDPDRWNANIKTGNNRDFSGLCVPHLTRAKNLLRNMLQFQPTDRTTIDEILNNWNFRQEDDLERVVDEERRQRKERILMFLKTSEKLPLSLCSLDPSAQTDKYDDEVKLEKIINITTWGNDAFSAVACGDSVFVLSWVGYLFECRPLDPNPSWKRVNDATRVLHGRWPSAVVIEGLIYICGGGFDETGSCTRQNSLQNTENAVIQFSPAVKICEVYDTTNSRWLQMRQLNEGRRHHSAVVMEGKIYLIGGRDVHSQVLGSTEVYDPETKTWSVLPAALTTPRYKGGAVAYEGKIYLHGGLNDAHATLSDIECFDPVTGSWSVYGDMFVPRSLFRVCVCDSKLFAVAGDAYPGSGLGEFPARMSIGMYDPSKAEGWKKIKALSGMSLESSATLVFSM